MRRLIGFRTVGATAPGPGPDPDPEPNEHFTVDANGIIRAPDLSIFRPDGSNVTGANSYVWSDSFDAHGKAATFQARGYRAVRLVYCERCESHSPGSSNYGAIADLVAEYTSLGMVVIIDNHEYDLGGAPPTSGDIAETVALMGGFAQQFGDNPYVWYECFNEPFDEGFGNALDLQTWLDIHRPVCTAIRQHTEAPILCCASMFGQDRGGYGGVRVEDSSLLNGIPTLMSEFGTVIGDLHGYHRWGGATTAEDHRGYWTEARNRGVAIVVGEFGAWGLHGEFDSQEREASELWWAESPRYAGLIPWMTGNWGDEFWAKHATYLATPVEDDYDDGSPGGGDEAFLVGTGSFTSTSTVNSTTVPLPAHQEGDALVAMVAINQATGTIDTPSGWTAFANATTGANVTSRAFWRRAPSGGAGESVTISHSGSRRTSGVSAVVRDGGDPYMTARSSSGGTVATNESLSIAGDSALMVAMVGYRTGGMEWAAQGLWSEEDAADGGGTNTGARVAVRSENPSGSFSAETVWTNAGSFTNWDLYAIAFDSAGEGGSGELPEYEGFPETDGSNTGAREPTGGWQAAPISGGTGLWQYFTEGGTIENVYLEGQIRVRASNVTIRNCYVVANFENQAGIWGFEGDNLVVENCTVVGANMDLPAAAGVVGYQTCRRCNISNTADGLKGGSDPGELTEYNYIHNLRLGFTGTPHEPGVNNTHADGIQWQGADGAIVRYNRIHGPYYDDGGPDQPAGVTDDSVNGGIFMKTDSGDITNVTVEGNEVYGFGYNLYWYATAGRIVTGEITDNRLGRGTTDGYARFGPIQLFENTGDITATLDGNVDQDGQAVP